MAFRGRGRGRGGFRGGGGFGYAKQDPYILFPDIELPDRKYVQEQSDLISWNKTLQQFRMNSRYFLDDTSSEKTENKDIERYSDRLKSEQTLKSKRGPLSDVINLESAYFPAELVQGVKPSKRKKVQWEADSGLDRLSFFEKLEAKHGLDPNLKKELEEEDEKDAEEPVEEEEDESDGDYAQNRDFDDDDDDYNAESDGDDEGAYE